MTIQSILLGVIVSSLIGSLFHFWKGGAVWRLVLYLVLAWVGFWVGHFLADSLDLKFLSVGALNLGPGILTSALMVGVGYWLSLVQVQTKQSR